MMKIIFTDNTELEYIEALETSIFYDNATRRTLKFIIPRDAISLDDLDEIVSNRDNVTQIRLVNEEEGITNIYDNYEIKKGLSVNPIDVGEDENGTPIKEDRIILDLVKLTYTELQLKALGVL